MKSFGSRALPIQSSNWDVLANYEAQDIVRKLYKEKHGWQLNAELAREIAAPFIQARHYFNSAGRADRSVKPLLLYYGVFSLSRGLILFLQEKNKDAVLPKVHGLSTTPVWHSLLDLGIGDLADLKVKVQSSGWFVELLRSTGNRNLLRNNSSAVNYKAAGDPVPEGPVLELGELLAGLPDVKEQFMHWKSPRCFSFSCDKIGTTPELRIKVPRWPGAYIDDRLVIEVVGSDNCDLDSIDDKNIIVRTKNGANIKGFLTDRVGDTFGGIGDLYMAQSYSSGARLNKLAQLFALSYILGMIVRYHPNFWIDLIYQRSGGIAVPTFFRVIDCIEILYPQIVIDFLEENPAL